MRRHSCSIATVPHGNKPELSQDLAAVLVLLVGGLGRAIETLIAKGRISARNLQVDAQFASNAFQEPYGLVRSDSEG